MPHVTIKLYPGRTKDQKSRLAAQIVQDVMAVLQCEESGISVVIQDVQPEDWNEKVYRAEILDNAANLFKKPGYNPF